MIRPIILAWGLVSISAGQLNIYDANSVISVSTAGSQPGTMSGTFDSDTIFEAENVLSGGCTERYEIIGQFVAPMLNATLSATYIGDGCFDCAINLDLTAYR